MKALAKLALTLCLMLSALPGFGQTQTISTAPPDFNRAELDQMLAPIALYPDTVLSHVLIAATYPLEVVQADRWARNNPGLDAQAALNAVEDQDWDPSVKALVAFPEILQRMSDDLDWTQRIGDAFLADEGEVMGVIQDLRQKAYASGSLDKLEYVRVQREEKVIVIEPAVERVVYVPYYDTRVVYGGWWWPDYPPVYWHHPRNHVVVGGFYWGPRVHVAPSFYFSSFHWHRRHVVVVDYHRHHRHPRFHSARSIAHYDGARHWRHNPHHRRGVVYRNDNVRHHYGSKRESYRNLQEQRNPNRNFSAGGQSRPVNSNNQRNPREQNHVGPRPNVQRDGQGKHIQRNDSPRPNIQRTGQNDAERIKERLANGNAQANRNAQQPRQLNGVNGNNASTRKDAERNQARPNLGGNPNRDNAQPTREHRLNTQQRTTDGATRRENLARPQTQSSNNIQRPNQVQSINRPQNVERPRNNYQRPEVERRTENVQRTHSRPTDVNSRRAEQSRPHTQRGNDGNGAGNVRGRSDSGGREVRRNER